MINSVIIVVHSVQISGGKVPIVVGSFLVLDSVLSGRQHTNDGRKDSVLIGLDSVLIVVHNVLILIDSVLILIDSVLIVVEKY